MAFCVDFYFRESGNANLTVVSRPRLLSIMAELKPQRKNNVFLLKWESQFDYRPATGLALNRD